MRRNRRNARLAQTTDVPRVCPCGAFIESNESKGALCRKCRRRLRWVQRMSGRRRDQWRQHNQSNHNFREAVIFT